MTALLLLAACAQLPDQEVTCDGLDDDQDGVIDEGLIGHSFEFLLTTSAEGDETGFQISAQFQDEQRVFLTREDFVGQETVAAYEELSEFNQDGLIAETKRLDLLTEQRVTLRWSYDEQLRQTSMRQASEGSCTEYVTVYDDELDHKFDYGLAYCGYLNPGEPAEVTGYDHAHRVIFHVLEKETSSWTWGEESRVESYRSPDGSERHYSYEEDRLIGASATGVLAPWALDYDAESRLKSYRSGAGTALSSGLDLDYSDSSGGFVSKVFAEYEGAPRFEQEHLFDSFGNLVGAIYTDLLTGGSTTGVYEHTCHEVD